MDISNYLKFIKPKIKIMSKKDVISLIAHEVKLVTNPEILKKKPHANWMAIAKKIQPLSAEEASRMYYGIKQGTRVDSTDIKGAFDDYCKNIKRVKKPKQQKLL